MKKNKSVIQLLLFGDVDGEEDIKLKNIRQTGMCKEEHLLKIELLYS